MTHLQELEHNLARELRAFDEGLPGRRRAKPIAKPVTGLTVRLAVRRKRLEMDQVFTHRSRSISRLEARIEAEQAARKAGWPIVGYVIDYRQQGGSS